MKHLFIVNPAAGKFDHTQYFTNRIKAVCDPWHLDYEIRVSSHKGNCTELAREAGERGEECRIYACGGDGTLNEVVCGAVGYPNLAVTHFPGGSGNDFIRIFDDPGAFSDLDRLLDPDEALLDLIRVGDLGYSINICSIGIDARVAAAQSRYKRLPLITGSGAYNLSLVVNVLKGICRPYSVVLDGKALHGQQTLICIANGRFYGGGWQPMPDAMPDDGMLEVLVVKPVSLIQLLQVIGKYKHGNYRELPDIIRHYRVSELRITSPQDRVINADGEILDASEIAFSVAKEKLRFFYPKGLSYSAKIKAFERKEEKASAISS